MIFGESLGGAASSEPAEWIGESIDGEPWTVGTLVPNRYESLLRLHAPDPTPDGWWKLYRDLFVLVASFGADHTTTPTRAWFAIWEGHGFDTATTHVAWLDQPANDAERQWRAAERERLRIAHIQGDQSNTTAHVAIERMAGTAIGTKPMGDPPLPLIALSSGASCRNAPQWCRSGAGPSHCELDILSG